MTLQEDIDKNRVFAKEQTCKLADLLDKGDYEAALKLFGELEQTMDRLDEDVYDLEREDDV